MSTDTDFMGSRGLIREQAQRIVDILNFDLKINVLNVYSSVDLLKNTAKIEKTKLDYMNYAHLLKYAKGFIGIDSCLNHMSANKFCSTKGVVLWNDENVIERFSYDKNINMITNTPRVMRFDVNEVIDNFQKIRRKND
jgi:ADP-heptose:LPS heptosyltransferase